MNRIHQGNHTTYASLIAGIVSIFLVQFLSPGAAAAEEELIYTMSKGDNLWNITERYLDDGFSHWSSLIRLNHVTDPKHMPKGTQLHIPLSWLKIESATVRVRDAYGDVQYSGADKTKFNALKSNMVLTDGDKIIVGEGANVVLEFADKSQLFLGSGSQLELAQIRKFSNSGLADSKMELQEGRTETRVKTKNTRFQITTPSANTTVRGTDFRVTVDSENSDLSRVEVLAGIVRTRSTGGSRDVKAGFGTTINKDESPRSLVKLLPKPEIQSPPNYSRKLPVDVKWQAIIGAKQYRIQIRKAVGEQTLLLDKVIPKPRFNTSALEDGSYIIQVRAIDINGLEGKNSNYSLQLDARPQAPLPISPGNDKIVRMDLPEFEWSTPIGSTGYHFILSEHPDLSTPLIDSTKLTGTHFTPEDLIPGKYYWQMATFAKTKKGPWGQIQSFTLQPAPKAPDLSKMSTEEGENSLTIRWQPGTKGQQYKIQLATDPEFKNIVVEEQLKIPEFKANRPSEVVHLRIKVIDVDGFEGDWSPAQKIEVPLDPWYYFLIPTVPFLTLFLLAL